MRNHLKKMITPKPPSGHQAERQMYITFSITTQRRRLEVMLAASLFEASVRLMVSIE
ncbi:protein of unknown function [Azospirillum lipoferum 4B]|uniref:Uncharacterized protein n=1 Tax=Azospirillum lipoferum (strain 4B) TaxID=862719 RepID=G7Z1U0_AZOL4|nr:protein of unknown function [Azospirillum lipoferum 4B]